MANSVKVERASSGYHVQQQDSYDVEAAWVGLPNHFWDALMLAMWESPLSDKAHQGLLRCEDFEVTDLQALASCNLRDLTFSCCYFWSCFRRQAAYQSSCVLQQPRVCRQSPCSVLGLVPEAAVVELQLVELVCPTPFRQPSLVQVSAVVHYQMTSSL